jgi:hypothetical protein
LTMGNSARKVAPAADGRFFRIFSTAWVGDMASSPPKEVAP